MRRNTKETAFQRRMKEFHEARQRIAASRQRAKGDGAWQRQTGSSDSPTG